MDHVIAILNMMNGETSNKTILKAFICAIESKMKMDDPDNEKLKSEISDLETVLHKWETN